MPYIRRSRHWSYYNENDPFCADWLRQLIKAKRLPAGFVDSRSIKEVQSTDVEDFTHVHFFAGIGGWPLALRLANWPEDRQVWTGSCPCQPYSTAGKRRAHADPRDLWPDFLRLIAFSHPHRVFGEQVAASIGHHWLDRVCTNLEEEDYACGSAVLGAHSIGAPHIRQRLYWGGADLRLDQSGRLSDAERRRTRDLPSPARAHQAQRDQSQRHGDANSNAGPARLLADSQRSSRRQINQPRTDHLNEIQSREEDSSGLGERSSSSLLGISSRARLPLPQSQTLLPPRWRQEGGAAQQPSGSSNRKLGQPSIPRRSERSGRSSQIPQQSTEQSNRPISNRSLELPNVSDSEGQTSGGKQPLRDSRIEAAFNFDFWSYFTLLPCLDGKYRRTQPGIHPLAAGVPSRLGKLRGYGNAIVPPLAARFILSFEEAVKSTLG